MIFITNLFNLPFLIVIWIIEAYLFLIAVRLIIARIPNVSKSHFLQQLKQLTDPLPDIVSRGLAKWRNKPIPSWVAWLTVILLGCAIRQILVLMIVTRALHVQ